ncbi:hypothetical protein RhiirA1_539001 [Rhizophagus irregularis]|uniref:Uncharacterized protein n=1 Tax=Rhizophagus irregularis TaxID=588596 RepID=A0A2N0REG3_9GLOM|nr:hypothetical protein RhiirA1_539001 [Rhizophagus irregularis]
MSYARVEELEQKNTELEARLALLEQGISDYNIYVVANNDVIMTSLIVYSLKKRCANNVCLLVPATPNEVKLLLKSLSLFFLYIILIFSRTRLHQMLIDYDFERFQQTSPSQLTTNWILFQVGIFVTSTFNSPNQFIFLNVTVKDDLASLIVESIINPRFQANCNYVVGEQFIAHTFLGHIYQVFNKD